MPATESEAWAAHNDNDIEYLKNQGFTCVHVTVQESAQAGSGAFPTGRFDCHFDGDWNRCDKDCVTLGLCKRRTSSPPASADEGMVTAAANAIELLRQEAESIRSSNEVRVEGHPRYGTFDSDQYGEMAKEDFERLTAAADALAKTHGLSS